MKYFLVMLTFAGLQAQAQSNQDFDLKLTTTHSTSNGTTEQICKVTYPSKDFSQVEDCLPVATMNDVSLDLENTYFSEDFVKVGHMDLVELAKQAEEVRATQENPEEYAYTKDVTPKLPAIMSLDQDKLAAAVDRFSVLSVRRVAVPVGYMEMLEIDQKEAAVKYSQYVDSEQRVFRVPVYFNLRWESGVTQGTLQVVAEITLPIIDEMEEGDVPEDFTMEDLFRPSVLQFSDTKTTANLGRGIERNLRVISWSTYSQQTADEKTLELLNNVVAPYVGNYLYAVPIQKFIGYVAIEALSSLGNPDGISVKIK